MPLQPPPPPMSGGLAMPPDMGMPPPPPPMQSPAEQAGMAAAALVPEQQAAMQAMAQEVLGALAAQFAGAPNPAAEAAQTMPAAMVAPDGGALVGDPNDPFGGA